MSHSSPSSHERVVAYARQHKHLKTSDITGLLGVSRQRAHTILKSLVEEGRLVKIGSTAKSSYALPGYARTHLEIYPSSFHKTYQNNGLEEDVVFSEIEQRWPHFAALPENVRRIIRYSLLEMLNNAIEHSRSRTVDVELSIADGAARFVIRDVGIGVFRNIMEHKRLRSELEAIQDVMKGKLTTAPEEHSGQGIFFTSKMADVFYLESFDHQLIMNNLIDDVFLKKPKRSLRGTRVSFSIALDSRREINDVFGKYTNMGEDSDYGFDRTEVRVKLYTREGSYISRSQARRILVGLDKFESITLDFKKVETVGQAFADEIFRVFRLRHPNIQVHPIHMNESVRFMVERVEPPETTARLFPAAR
ncbi:MAG TPA: DUF4325 domain-containing protein [Candidatus Paceibacterota bacterium]